MSRVLTDTERRILNVIKLYEKAIEEKRCTFGVQVMETGLGAILRGEQTGLYEVLSIKDVKDGKGKPAHWVRFTIQEFENYLHFLLAQSGMAYLANYQLVLTDGYVVTVEAHA
jgi:hypothetical protein